MPLYPADKIAALEASLVDHLKPKLAPTWDERNPSAGSGIRSLIALPGKYPTPLVQAAQHVGGIDIPQWASLISKTGEWELWVDPGSVVLRDGGWLWIDEGFESVTHPLGMGGARYGRELETPSAAFRPRKSEGLLRESADRRRRSACCSPPRLLDPSRDFLPEMWRHPD